MNVQRVIKNGIARLEADGKPVSPGFGRLQQPNYWAVEKLDQFMDLGYDLFFVQLGELESASWCWDGENGYDYRQYEIHLRAIIEKYPVARLILFLGGKPPARWQKNHPDEMILQKDGKRLDVANAGSTPWIADSTEAVRRFVAHFEASDLAGHIAGYNLLYVSNEWLLGWDRNTDFSPPVQERFRQWLRQEYRDDLAAFRRSWKDTGVTFEAATVPREVDYNAHGLKGMFDRHEKLGTKASDYLRFFNGQVADLLLAYARVVKQASQGKKLVSAMFGYAFCYSMGQRSPAHTGHVEMLRVLESPDVDLLHAPYDYYNRCLGGCHYSQITLDSVLLHGKVFADQIDSKTHVHRFDRGNAETPWEDEQLLKRDVAFSLTHNAYHYYYEMNVPCWRGRRGVVEFREQDFIPDNVQAIMKKLSRVAGQNGRELPASVTEVALFTSRQSNYYRAYDKRYAALYLQALRNYFLPYTAAPFHEFFLEDFDLIPQNYKVYLFPDANYVPAAQRQRIRQRLERAGATAVWFYAPGYLDETGGSLKSMEDLTGLRFRQDATRYDYLMIDYDRYDHPITAGLEQQRAYGSDVPCEFFQKTQEWLAWPLLGNRELYKFSPFFMVDDPGAIALGTLRGTSLPGLAVKEIGGMKSIFSTASCPTPELLRNIFRYAGVHLYSDSNDIVYANARYITVCCREGGAKTLRLPAKMDLYDALEDKLLARGVDHYRFTAEDKQVEMFRLGA